MSDVRVTSSLFSFVIDFQVYGYDTTSLFTTVSGAPAISSNKLRLNAAETRSKSQYLYGEYVFRMTIPTAPTSGDVRQFGLEGVAIGNRGALRFNIVDTRFYVSAYNNAGTLIGEETIAWNSDWTATATDYRIAWSEQGVTFKVVGSTAAHVAIANIQFGLNVVNMPLFLSVDNDLADNLDITYITLNNVGRVESLAEAASGGGGGGGSSGSGAASVGGGSGSGEYGNVLGDFVATPTNGAKTVTLSAFRDTTVQAALTDANFLHGYAKVTPAAGGAVETIPFTNVAWNESTYVLTLSDKATNFTTGDLIDLRFFSYPKELTNKLAGEDLSNDLIGTLFKAQPVPDYGGVFTTNASFTTTNAKAAAGNFLKLFVLNTTGNARYFQLHNTATTPGGGATAFFSVLVPANSYVIIGNDAFGPEGLHLNTGIAIANSTVAATYTAGTAGDLIVYYAFV
mgnify:CR=1 FL=1